jgi:hypothetical protein
MQVSIVGDLPAALPFIRECLSGEAGAVTQGWVYGPLADALSQAQLAVSQVASPEAACVGADGGLVAIAESTADASVRLARVAAQSGRHVLIFEPHDVSPAWAFELQLLLDESSTAIVPVSGRMLREQAGAGENATMPAIAGIRQIQLELSVPLPVEDNEAQWQRQALDIVSTLGISYSSVIAVEQRATDGSLLQRTLTLGASADSQSATPPAVILLRPEQQANQDRMVITSEGGARYEEAIPKSVALMPMLERLVNDRARLISWMSQCALSLELDYAARRSLKKRRAIDVHHDSGSERSVFKSQMTAIGCMILLLMMFGMVAYLVIATVFTPSDTVLRFLRGLWIAPAVLYLLAQLLLPIARDRAGSRES